MSTYQYFREACAGCGKDLPKRELHKLYVSYGHSSVSSPRKVCSLCDECLPDLFDRLGVPAPPEEIRWRKSRRLCYACCNYSAATAKYCSHCGKKLKERKENE